MRGPIFVQILVDAGISTCFANPGTSEMQLVYEIGMSDNVRPVLCLQEDVVTGAADGYGRMKGTPAFTLLHVASGFANGMAMLHNAGRASTPIVNVVGANASYHQSNYPEHELINGRVVDLARTVSHWCREARTRLSPGRVRHRGRGTRENGQDLHHCRTDELPLGRGLCTPELAGVSSRQAQDRPRVDLWAAAMLAAGKKTGLVLGNVALHGEALQIAGRIAARTGAVLLSETMPSRYLAHGEGRPPVELIPYLYEICGKFLESFEQLIFVGASFRSRRSPTGTSPR